MKCNVDVSILDSLISKRILDDNTEVAVITELLGQLVLKWPLTAAIIIIFSAVNFNIMGLAVFIRSMININFVHAIDSDSQLGGSVLISWNVLSNDQVCEPSVAILLQDIVDGCILDTFSSVIICQGDHNESLLVTNDWIIIRIEVECQHRSTEGAVEFITIH